MTLPSQMVVNNHTQIPSTYHTRKWPATNRNGHTIYDPSTSGENH